MPYTPRNYVRPAYESGLRFGDLFRRQGAMAADLEMRRGDASAQMWANLGNTIANTTAGILREREEAPIRQMQRENVELQNAAIKGEAQAKGMAQTIQGNALRQTEDGSWTYDRDYLTQAFQQAGIADRLPSVLEGLDAFDKSNQAVKQAKLEGLAGLAFSVTQLGNTPQAFNQAIDLALKNGYITSKEVGPLIQRVGDDPSKIGEVVSMLASQSPTFAAKLAPKQPENFTLGPGQKRFDAQGNEIASVAPNAPAPPSGFNLSPGQTRFGPDGKPIASLPAAPREDNEPLMSVIGPDGKPVFVRRSEAEGKTPATVREAPTEDERKSAGFYTQMQSAIKIIDELESKLTDKELYQIQSLPQEGLIGMANRGELSENAKRYLRAFEQFTEARLRPVSGAAINDAEYARDRRTYAKQFGETPKLAADRRAARDGAAASLRTRAGRALPKEGETTTQQPPPPPPPPGGVPSYSQYQQMRQGGGPR